MPPQRPAAAPGCCWPVVRDRPFRRHGVRVVERFKATRCYSDPDGVVREFLEVLARPVAG
jgi:hypothetical protein